MCVSIMPTTLSADHAQVPDGDEDAGNGADDSHDHACDSGNDGLDTVSNGGDDGALVCLSTHAVMSETLCGVPWLRVGERNGEAEEMRRVCFGGREEPQLCLVIYTTRHDVETGVESSNEERIETQSTSSTESDA